MKCKVCGSDVKDGSKFCENCGAKIEEEIVNVAPASSETINTEENVPEDVVSSEKLERVDGEIVNDNNTTQNDYSQSSTTQDTSSYASGTQERSYSNPQPAQNESKGFAIASLVCGIVALVCCCCTPISVICGGVAVGLGIYVVTQNLPGKEMAIAGIACGGLGLASFVFNLIANLIGFSSGIGNSLKNTLDFEDILDSLDI